MVSGWRALDDRRMELLFGNPRRFRAELAGLDGDPRAVFAEAGEIPQSWQSNFEGHLLRIVREQDDKGLVFGLYLDGEPIGTLEDLPPGWQLDGYSDEAGGSLL